MHRYLLMLLFISAIALSGWAQEERGPLNVSSSLLAVKVTNPEAQVNTFTPVLSMLDKVTEVKLAPGEPAPASLSLALSTTIAMIKIVPGVKTAGDFWFLVMPPIQVEEAVAPTSTPVETTPPGSGSDIPEMTPPKAPQTRMPVYLIMPLADPEAFQTYLDAKKDDPKALRGVVYGDSALMVFDGRLPSYSEIDFDIKLVAKQNIVASLQFGNLDMTGGESASPQLADLFSKYQDNIQRIECAFSMLGTSLSTDLYLVPAAGSQLEEDAGKSASNIPLRYAPYLPGNLAYANVSGPLMEGFPGTARSIMKMYIGTLSLLAGNDIPTDDFLASHAELTKMCSQGRALGIVPPGTPTGDFSADLPTLVAVYHASDNPNLRDAEKETRAIIRVFIREAMNLNDAFAKKRMTLLYITRTPEAETIDTHKIDLVKIRYTPQGLASIGKTAAVMESILPLGKKSFSLELRFAYINDKLLVTAGPGGKVQMANLITRVRTSQGGFTSTARYASLKLPRPLHAFEAYSTQDLTRLYLNYFAPDKRNLLSWVKAYPPLSSMVVNAQDGNDGCLHYNIRMPAEQTRYIFSLVKKLMEDIPLSSLPAPKQPKKKPVRR